MMADDNASQIVCLYSIYYTEEPNSIMNITTITTCFLTALLSLTGVVANGLVCLAILLNKDLQINSNILLLLLSFNDLVVAGISEPLYIVRRLLESQQRYICWITMTYRALWNISVGLSFIAITFISIERCFALFHPFRYKVYVTIHRLLIATLILAVVWVLFVLSRFVGLSTVSFYVITTPMIFSCIILITIAHIKIFKLARWHRRQISLTTYSNQEQCASKITRKSVNYTAREAKIAISTGFVVGAVFLCYFPLIVIVITNIIMSGRDTLFHYYILPWNDLLVFLNSVLNPLIYCWRSCELRSAIVRLFTFKTKTRVVNNNSFTVHKNNNNCRINQ